MSNLPYGLGRGEAPDPRDLRFSLKAAPLGRPDRRYRYWNAQGWWGNQGQNPWCVAYAWLHWLEDGPTTQPLTPHGGKESLLAPASVYCRAQDVDEWDGGCSDRRYDGTSVRAGAKVLQAEGLIESYWWAWDASTVVRALLETGPVVLGTWWYERMFYPVDGFVSIANSRAVGGHAYLANGVRLAKGLSIEEAVDQNAGFIRCKNSWGRRWGRRGHFYMDLHTLRRLIHEHGEACLAVETRRT